MKIILSRSELEDMQVGFDTLVDKVNEIDSSAEIEKNSITKYLEKLKDDVHFRYRLIKGDFEISVSEYMISDFFNMYVTSISKILPVVKVLEPAITMLVPIFGEIVDDYKSFFKKYSGANEIEKEVAKEVTREINLTALSYKERMAYNPFE